ncbi:adhesion G-protein coupled receptor G1 isoform X2 [Esox lucius]|uniref:adhesion G-protein coupled receptor G1 isoform X2 n=1 Tax=Esox lucius TaxID=8010 RepID=UPI001476F604|nr:adhesion G-protein coupled receptor G1 isoform X2 [Esox lucius]
MKTSDFLIFICISATININGIKPDCRTALEDCLQSNVESWTRCYEDKLATCIIKGRQKIPNFHRHWVNSSIQAEEHTRSGHSVHIPVNALQRSMSNDSYSTDFCCQQLGPDRGSRSVEVMNQTVLAVKVGHHAVSDLDQPVRILFKNNNVADRGTCVFWKESEENNGSGKWSSEGCETSLNHGTFVCRCNHLSFFAVLVNSKVSVDRVNAANLSYISYVGSALSVAFTAATLVMYMCFRKRHSEHSTGIHVQLTGALLFLHISYLLSEWWVWYKAGSSEGRVCLAFGMILHWALLSTFTWSAIEGFHLHVLLVRIFNIYVRKYLLKLSLVGWGIPTATVVACGFAGIYGRHSLYIKGSDNGSSTDICWISSLGMVVSYVTVSGYLGLVFLFNTAMLGVVMVKLWRQRGKGALYQERRSRMWKDWATVLGLSCVLGIPWGLAFCTYGPLSLIGLYLFSIFNSFQGVFMFLWFLALSRKGSAQQRSWSGKEPSSQKIMETSLN